MKRTGFLLLALIILFSVSGCCYAPGFEGSPFMEMRFMLPAKWGEQQAPDAVISDGVEETQPEPIILSDEAIASIEALPPREDSDFVNVRDYIPDIFVELKYGTKDNITGKAIYEFEDAYLRYGTVVKLMKVQTELREMGYSLKIWDAFRPVAAQYDIWEAYPNSTFVANPETGYSNHSRGNTVDITIVNGAGEEQEMPTGFDEFTSLADRNYGDCPEKAAANAQMLQDLMEKHGFVSLQAEWWHYTDATEYEVETVVDPSQVATWYAECNEYINIRVAPDATSQAIGTIPADDPFTLLGWSGDFAFIDYNGQRGYVNGYYIRSTP